MADTCVTCGAKIGFFDVKRRVADGLICSECLDKVGFSSSVRRVEFQELAAWMDITPAGKLGELVERMEATHELRKKLKHNYRVGNYAFFDDADQAFLMTYGYQNCFDPGCYRVIRYGDAIGFELLENGQTVSSGGLGKAVAGGLLFGASGAVVGAVWGKKQKNMCTSLKVKVTVRNMAKPSYYTEFLIKAVEFGSAEHRAAQQNAQNVLSKLQNIVDSCAAAAGGAGSSSLSPAVQIREFKALLNEGIITQEEFERKKAQLLEQ